MEFEEVYLRKRSEFGSMCMFASEGPNLNCNLMPDKTLAEDYLVKNPVNKGIQDRCVFSVHEVNTFRADYADRGMNHEQGGWPKDLNILDEEAVLRYRKKLEREDNYVESLKQLTKTLEHAVLQNNAVNIYETYYEDTVKEYSVKETLSLIRNEFSDFGSQTGRPVTHLSWCPIWEAHFAVSYCNTLFQTGSHESTEAYIWNVEIPNVPVHKFDSKIPIVNLEWNNSDINILAGGMMTGDIAIYDTRKAPMHVSISPDVLRHRDPVHSVLWLNSKSGSDFFSTSSDGVIKWWDCRNLKNVVDLLILDLGRTQKMSQAQCASCLEFDASIPARFMVGTEDGYVIGGNRKGTNLAEKLPWSIKTHYGPVFSIQRNQAFTKNFLTVGDWRARIWSEECRESPIMWTKSYKVPLVAGEWSRGRYSVFILARADGYLDLWDLLQDQIFPTVSMRISETPLTAVRFEGEGRFAIVGDDKGKSKLVQFGDRLVSTDKNDKVILSAMFDRETRREKILESRIREIKLAMKLKAEQGKAEEAKAEVEGEGGDENILRAEEDYLEAVFTAKAAYAEALKQKEDVEAGEDEEEDEQEEVAPPAREEAKVVAAEEEGKPPPEEPPVVG